LRAHGIELLVGPRFARRLALSHAIDDFADAMVNLSLVGSLFISASLDASRSRIMLYLLLTAAPLAVAAPIVGPALDRSRLGYRAAIAGSQIIRAAVALAMIGSLLSVALYPLAFTVLICRKIYGLAKTALLTQMTDDRDEFLRAESHITRTGTLVGGLGVIAGGILLAQGSVTAMLLTAAPLFLLSGLISTTLPTPTPELNVRSVPRLSELIPPYIWRATIAVTAIRASAGALTYLLAFAIKRGGNEWIFAAGLLVAGVGALLATLAAPRLHRALEPDGVLVLALLVPGVVTAIGVVTIGNVGVIAIAFAIGLGNGVAGRSIAVLQSKVPTLARGRAIARSELLFQLAGLIGAGLAVQLAPSPRPGFAVASVVLIGAGIAYTLSTRRSLREQASRMMLGDQAPAVHRALPDALLAEAERLASLGAYRMAIVVAEGAVHVAVSRDAVGRPALNHWQEFDEQITSVKNHDDQPDAELVVKVLAEAKNVIDERQGPAKRHWRSSQGLP
jgi:predicted MFS family arabinose efflux permease